MRYHHCAIGGTFDHFHKGHEAFIDKAFVCAKRVSIGIADSSMYKGKPLSLTIESYKARNNSVIEYIYSSYTDLSRLAGSKQFRWVYARANSFASGIKQKGYEKRFSMHRLIDIFGTTIEDTSIDVLVVTKETLANGKRINEERKKRNIKELAIIILPYVLAEDKKPITSERIRMGEIDREGYVYAMFMKDREKLVLPNNLRKQLRKSIGILIDDNAPIHIKKPTMIISVGDMSTIMLIKNKLYPNVQIIDFRTRRGDISSSESAKLPVLQTANKCTNPSGTITKEAWMTVFSAIVTFLKTQKPQQVIVDGEEDLLTLPMVLAAPLGSVVVYGQYQKGKVIVDVTEEKKRKVEKLLGKFL